jgi:hypothetical protein
MTDTMLTGTVVCSSRYFTASPSVVRRSSPSFDTSVTAVASASWRNLMATSFPLSVKKYTFRRLLTPWTLTTFSNTTPSSLRRLMALGTLSRLMPTAEAMPSWDMAKGTSNSSSYLA